MSIFENQAVCERVNFFSHHIDPIIANTSGVLTLSNGHTTSSGVADQKYTLTTVASSDSSNDHLQIIGQSGGPSPAVLAMDIAPNGTVNFASGTATSSLTVAPVNQTAGNGGSVTIEGAAVGSGQPSSVMPLIYFNNVSSNMSRWGIGIRDEETGGNTGSDLIVRKYNDDGSPAGVALQISRASGQASFGYNMNIDGNLFAIGNNSASPMLSVVGPNGTGTIHDTIYNPPSFNLLINRTGIVGGGPYPNVSNPMLIGGTFTVPQTGVYSIQFAIALSVQGSAPVVSGNSDSVVLGIRSTALVNKAFSYFFPRSMPANATDYTLHDSHNGIVLSSTDTYQVFWYANNLSGTLQLGNTNSGVGVNIVNLS